MDKLWVQVTVFLLVAIPVVAIATRLLRYLWHAFKAPPHRSGAEEVALADWKEALAEGVKPYTSIAEWRADIVSQKPLDEILGRIPPGFFDKKPEPKSEVKLGDLQRHTEFGSEDRSGFVGISGYKGPSGISGFSGYQAASGISGFSGYAPANVLSPEDLALKRILEIQRSFTQDTVQKLEQQRRLLISKDVSGGYSPYGAIHQGPPAVFGGGIPQKPTCDMCGGSGRLYGNGGMPGPLCSRCFPHPHYK
jgi:hypothetical protein